MWSVKPRIVLNDRQPLPSHAIKFPPLISHTALSRTDDITHPRHAVSLRLSPHAGDDSSLTNHPTRAGDAWMWPATFATRRTCATPPGERCKGGESEGGEKGGNLKRGASGLLFCSRSYNSPRTTCATPGAPPLHPRCTPPEAHPASSCDPISFPLSFCLPFSLHRDFPFLLVSLDRTIS